MPVCISQAPNGMMPSQTCSFCSFSVCTFGSNTDGAVNCTIITAVLNKHNKN